MYDDSLVLMYNFDNVSALGENDTYVVDISPTRSNSTSVSGRFTTGKYGGAFHFNRSNNITISSTFLQATTDQITVAAWIKADNWGSGIHEGSIVCNDNWEDGFSHGFCLRAGDNGKLDFVLGDGDVSWNNAFTTSIMSVDTWHHVVGVYDGASIHTYIDGVQRATTNVVFTIDPSTTPLFIGWGSYTDPSRQFNGTIDEVRIWNRSLSAEEIYQQYVSNLKKVDSDSWELYVNQSKNATAGLDDGEYTYQIVATDSATNSNQTQLRTITIDTTYPTWSNNKTNLTASTTSSSSVYFNITLTETNPDSYIFSWYNTSEWINDSAQSYTNGQEIQVIKTIPANGTINWTWYFNDTAGNMNQSDVWSITVNEINDTDNAGLPNNSDPLLYNESNVSTSGVDNLNITVG
jgi:hypothetical protein